MNKTFSFSLSFYWFSIDRPRDPGGRSEGGCWEKVSLYNDAIVNAAGIHGFCMNLFHLLFTAYYTSFKRFYTTIENLNTKILYVCNEAATSTTQSTT